jgi:hypothetical protein
MTDLTTEYETEESYDMGSFNHGYLQARLVLLLGNIGNYTPVTELSLDISHLDLSKFDIKVTEEIRPDICLYPKRKIDLTHDIQGFEGDLNLSGGCSFCGRLPLRQ